MAEAVINELKKKKTKIGLVSKIVQQQFTERSENQKNLLAMCLSLLPKYNSVASFY